MRNYEDDNYQDLIMRFLTGVHSSLLIESQHMAECCRVSTGRPPPDRGVSRLPPHPDTVSTSAVFLLHSRQYTRTGTRGSTRSRVHWALAPWCRSGWERRSWAGGRTSTLSDWAETEGFSWKSQVRPCHNILNYKPWPSVTITMTVSERRSR